MAPPVNVAFSFFSLFNSCSSSEDPSPNENAFCGIDRADGTSTLTATFNGELYCPTFIEGGPGELQSYIAQPASSPPIDSILYISINAAVKEKGTFTVENGEVMALLQTQNDRDNHYVAMDSENYESSGMVTIEELTDSQMKGTFELVLVATTRGGGSGEPTGAPDLIISDGKFHIVFEN